MIFIYIAKTLNPSSAQTKPYHDTNQAMKILKSPRELSKESYRTPPDDR